MVRSMGRALLALLLLCSTPVPAHAQFFEIMDWLERLSGPTLPGMWADVPLVCRVVDDGSAASVARYRRTLPPEKGGSTVTGPLRTGGRPYPTLDVPARAAVFELDAKTQEDLIKAAITTEIDNLTRTLRSLQPAQSRVRLEPSNVFTKSCSPVVLGMSKVKVQGASGETTVEELEAVFKRSIVAGVRVGLAGVKKPLPFNGKNDLTYDPGVSDEQKEMWVFAFGPSLNWSVHPKLDLMWAFELNRFSGPQFETFWRPSVDAIDLAFRPFAKQDSRSLLDVLQVTLRAKKYLGSFSAEDFGATPGTYLAERESVLSLGVSVDITRLIWRR